MNNFVLLFIKYLLLAKDHDSTLIYNEEFIFK